MALKAQYSLLSLSIAVVAGGAILLAALCIGRRIQETPQALVITMDAVHSYLKATDGQWPSSWENLSQQGECISTERFEWPRDVLRISELVHLDFDVDMAAVAEQSPWGFQAIRGRWFSTSADREQVTLLLEDIRGFEALRKRRDSQGPSPMKELWRAVLARNLPWENVSVEYCCGNTHFAAAWEDGVTECTLRGEGSLCIKRMLSGQETTEIRRLDQSQVESIFRLVWDLEMWEQRTPTRTIEADEVTCTVRLRVGNEQAEVWEWFNDMELHGRILGIRRKMLDKNPVEAHRPLPPPPAPK